MFIFERGAHAYTEKKMEQVRFVPLLPGVG
jgi:hypothetical protein